MADDLSYRPDSAHSVPALPDYTAANDSAAKEAVADAKRKKRKKVLLLALAGKVALVAGVAGFEWWTIGRHYVSTDNAYVGAATAQINSQVSGQVLRVLAEDTQAVHKGDVLALIDPTDAELQLARAEADYERTLQKVRQYYTQVAAAAAQVRARKAEMDRAVMDYARRRDLAATGAVSQEELTTAKAAADAARANLAAADQTLNTQRALADGGVETHPEAQAARAAVETAKLALKRTVILAPVDGVVTQKTAQVGQRIDPGQPLMMVTPLSSAYVDANFKEGQLTDVRVGQPVHLVSDLYGDKVVYHGRVAGLGGGTGSAFAIIPAQNATGNWIKVVQRVPVRIALDPVELARKPLRVGLSMEARIDVRQPKL